MREKRTPFVKSSTLGLDVGLLMLPGRRASTICLTVHGNALSSGSSESRVFKRGSQQRLYNMMVAKQADAPPPNSSRLQQTPIPNFVVGAILDVE